MIFLAFDITTIISSVVVFLGFNLLLVFIILYGKIKTYAFGTG